MKNSVYAICLKIRAVQPEHVRLRTGRRSQPLVSLEMYDRALTAAKISATAHTGWFPGTQ
jgi:hypothetical protein